VAEILIRPTVFDDGALLTEHMREADRAELHAVGHDDLGLVVERSIANSIMCWSAFADGKLGCIIGVSPLSMVSGIGSPWMLGTPVLDAHSRILVRKTPEYIARMLNAFPHLMNFVHAKNITSVRWLRRVGFTLRDAVPYGPLGEPFHLFEMKATDV
jgi:hypothetical protein